MNINLTGTKLPPARPKVPKALPPARIIREVVTRSQQEHNLNQHNTFPQQTSFHQPQVQQIQNSFPQSQPVNQNQQQFNLQHRPQSRERPPNFGGHSIPQSRFNNFLQSSIGTASSGSSSVTASPLELSGSPLDRRTIGSTVPGASSQPPRSISRGSVAGVRASSAGTHGTQSAQPRLSGGGSLLISPNVNTPVISPGAVFVNNVTHTYTANNPNISPAYISPSPQHPVSSSGKSSQSSLVFSSPGSAHGVNQNQNNFSQNPNRGMGAVTRAGHNYVNNSSLHNTSLHGGSNASGHGSVPHSIPHSSPGTLSNSRSTVTPSPGVGGAQTTSLNNRGAILSSDPSDRHTHQLPPTISITFDGRTNQMESTDPEGRRAVDSDVAEFGPGRFVDIDGNEIELDGIVDIDGNGNEMVTDIDGNPTYGENERIADTFSGGHQFHPSHPFYQGGNQYEEEVGGHHNDSEANEIQDDNGNNASPYEKETQNVSAYEKKSYHGSIQGSLGSDRGLEGMFGGTDTNKKVDPMPTGALSFIKPHYGGAAGSSIANSKTKPRNSRLAHNNQPAPSLSPGSVEGAHHLSPSPVSKSPQLTERVKVEKGAQQLSEQECQELRKQAQRELFGEQQELKRVQKEQAQRGEEEEAREAKAREVARSKKMDDEELIYRQMVADAAGRDESKHSQNYSDHNERDVDQKIHSFIERRAGHSYTEHGAPMTVGVANQMEEKFEVEHAAAVLTRPGSKPKQNFRPGSSNPSKTSSASSTNANSSNSASNSASSSVVIEPNLQTQTFDAAVPVFNGFNNIPQIIGSSSRQSSRQPSKASSMSQHRDPSQQRNASLTPRSRIALQTLTPPLQPIDLRLAVAQAQNQNLAKPQGILGTLDWNAVTTPRTMQRNLEQAKTLGATSSQVSLSGAPAGAAVGTSSQRAAAEGVTPQHTNNFPTPSPLAAQTLPPPALPLSQALAQSGLPQPAPLNSTLPTSLQTQQQKFQQFQMRMGQQQNTSESAAASRNHFRKYSPTRQKFNNNTLNRAGMPAGPILNATWDLRGDVTMTAVGGVNGSANKRSASAMPRQSPGSANRFTDSAKFGGLNNNFNPPTRGRQRGPVGLSLSPSRSKRAKSEVLGGGSEIVLI